MDLSGLAATSYALLQGTAVDVPEGHDTNSTRLFGPKRGT
jgi:hypothetical protein